MSRGIWNLEPASELEVLVRWELDEPDMAVRNRVRAFLDGLLIQPLGHGQQDVPGIYWEVVPRTDVTLVWTLDVDRRLIVLALVGRD